MCFSHHQDVQIGAGLLYRRPELNAYVLFAAEIGGEVWIAGERGGADVTLFEEVMVPFAALLGRHDPSDGCGDALGLGFGIALGLSKLAAVGYVVH